MINKLLKLFGYRLMTEAEFLKATRPKHGVFMGPIVRVQLGLDSKVMFTHTSVLRKSGDGNDSMEKH